MFGVFPLITTAHRRMRRRHDRADLCVDETVGSGDIVTERSSSIGQLSNLGAKRRRLNTRSIRTWRHGCCPIWMTLTSNVRDARFERMVLFVLPASSRSFLIQWYTSVSISSRSSIAYRSPLATCSPEMWERSNSTVSKHSAFITH